MGIIGASKLGGGGIIGCVECTFWCTMMESKLTMTVAQRDLPRITSTFQAIKLLGSRKVSIIIISIVGGNRE